MKDVNISEPLLNKDTQKMEGELIHSDNDDPWSLKICWFHFKQEMLMRRHDSICDSLYDLREERDQLSKKINQMYFIEMLLGDSYYQLDNKREQLHYKIQMKHEELNNLKAEKRQLYEKYEKSIHSKKND